MTPAEPAIPAPLSPRQTHAMARDWLAERGRHPSGGPVPYDVAMALISQGIAYTPRTPEPTLSVTAAVDTALRSAQSASTELVGLLTPEPTGDTREQVARDHERIFAIIRAWTPADENQADAAADAILAALPPAREAEVERLREALGKIAAFKRRPEYGDWADKVDGQGYNRAGQYAADIARAALSASDGKEGVSDAETETQWEVWQGDDWQASSDSEAEGRHYLAVYAQDGPARLVKAVTTRTTAASLHTTTETGK